MQFESSNNVQLGQTVGVAITNKGCEYCGGCTSCNRCSHCGRCKNCGKSVDTWQPTWQPTWYPNTIPYQHDQWPNKVWMGTSGTAMGAASPALNTTTFTIN